MADNSFSCIVVEKDKKPMGIFTERDVVDLYNKGIDLQTLTVDKVMTSPVITITVKTPLYQAVKLMNNNKIRRLIVVDNKGIITGIITQYDIIKGQIVIVEPDIFNMIRIGNRPIKLSRKQMRKFKVVE